VVVVGGETEGTGEILAAGLRRAGAVLVGQKTVGHAPHMRLVNDGDLHLWLPVAYWLDAADEPIDHGGIEPDEVVEQAGGEDSDDAEDVTLQRALELARGSLEAAA
jgi:C-terminal processing protease CtpA/Prc